MKKERELTYRTSRIYYIHNYIIVALVAVIIFIVSPSLNIFQNLMHLALFFGLLAIASGFLEEPEWHILFNKYIVTNHELIKVEGILNKKRTVIPFQSVSDISVTKSFMGRIVDVGNIYVRGYKEGGDIMMKGMKNPEEVHRIIQNKMNLFRETTIKAGQK